MCHRRGRMFPVNHTFIHSHTNSLVLCQQRLSLCLKVHLQIISALHAGIAYKYPHNVYVYFTNASKFIKYRPGVSNIRLAGQNRHAKRSNLAHWIILQSMIPGFSLHVKCCLFMRFLQPEPINTYCGHI